MTLKNRNISTVNVFCYRSLQNSMAKLVEEKNTEENRRRAARDIISTAIRTGELKIL